MHSEDVGFGEALLFATQLSWFWIKTENVLYNS